MCTAVKHYKHLQNSSMNATYFGLTYQQQAIRPKHVAFTDKLNKSVSRQYNTSLNMSKYNGMNSIKIIFIVTPCMLSSYSTNTPTNAHIQKLHIKPLKLLRHVSVLRPSSGSYIFLAKVTLKIVTD